MGCDFLFFLNGYVLFFFNFLFVLEILYQNFVLFFYFFGFLYPDSQ